MEFLFSLPVLVLFALIYMQAPSWYILAWPLAMLIQTVFLVGIGLTLAPLAVLYTDVRRLLRVVLRVLFYLSPIIYGVRDVQDRAPDWVATIYILNPLAGVFDLYRAAFFPEFFAGWTEVVVAAVVSALFLAMGTVVFSRLEGRALKESDAVRHRSQQPRHLVRRQPAAPEVDPRHPSPEEHSHAQGPVLGPARRVFHGR